MTETPPTPSPTRLEALTGIRIVAALWVVVFHFRGNLASEFESYVYIAPIVEYGELGVDLFFTLSGFVIALVYARKLGAGWTTRGTLTFWWARFARLWPAYFFVLLVVSVWHISLLWTGQHDPVAPRDLSLGSFLRQVFMVVQWTEADSDRLTWNGPAWTVSAEVLAYLLFPVFAIVAIRVVDRIALGWLPVLAVTSTLPLVVSAIARDSLYAPWTWALRIACCFLSGYIMFHFTDRVRRRSARSRWAGPAFLVLTATFVGIAWVAYSSGHHSWGFLGIALFPLMVGSLALDRSAVARTLSTRPFVLGGTISYSVYLVHMPIIEPIWAMQSWIPWLAPNTIGSQAAFLLVPFLVLLAGYALWRWVEEPSRRGLMAFWTNRTRASAPEPRNDKV